MNCPNDGTVLVMSDRQGIEIDYCPQCRGVWLDRGELDKIIERSASGDATHAEPRPQPQHYDQGDSRPYRQESHHDSKDYSHKKHRKEGFLGDLFDF
jgi:uncharacterized protein